jgi:hypothetical protein
MAAKQGLSIKVVFYFDKKELTTFPGIAGAFASHSNTWGEEAGKKVTLELFDWINEGYDINVKKGTKHIEARPFMTIIEQIINTKFAEEIEHMTAVEVRKRLKTINPKSNGRGDASTQVAAAIRSIETQTANIIETTVPSTVKKLVKIYYQEFQQIIIEQIYESQASEYYERSGDILASLKYKILRDGKVISSSK